MVIKKADVKNLAEDSKKADGDRQLLLKRIGITIVIIVLAVIIDYFVQAYIYKMGYTIVEDETMHIFQIDEFKTADGRLILDGFVFQVQTDALTEDFTIILYDYADDKDYYMNVSDEKREDVNQYFDCEYNYAESGFVADIKLDKLDLENADYEIRIRRNESRNVYRTGYYLSDGQVICADPESYKPLENVTGDLKTVVDNGVLRVYRPDVGMYVYQYDNKLYWVADANYYFEPDGSTLIQYQLWTSNNDKLPAYRLENNWLFDNISFDFENNEISNVGDYRVACAALPTEYPITTIKTGFHDERGWVWVNDFRPWYEFD